MKYIFILIFFYSLKSFCQSECNPGGVDLSCPKGGTFPIHLTFDDGPEPNTPSTENPEIIQNNTRRVADALYERGVTGTFYASSIKLEESTFKMDRMQRDSSGRWIFKKPADVTWTESDAQNSLATLQYLQSMGMRIGNHTRYHYNHCKQSGNVIRENINHSFEDFNEYGFLNPPPPTIRLPYGAGHFSCENNHATSTIRQAMIDNGAVHVGWTIDSEDWRYNQQYMNDPEGFQNGNGYRYEWSNDQEKYVEVPIRNLGVNYMLKAVSEQVCAYSGGIALFHEHHNITADNIGCIIDELKKAGHRFVDLGDPELRENLRNKESVLRGAERPEIGHPVATELQDPCPPEEILPEAARKAVSMNAPPSKEDIETALPDAGWEIYLEKGKEVADRVVSKRVTQVQEAGSYARRQVGEFIESGSDLIDVTRQEIGQSIGDFVEYVGSFGEDW